MQKCPSSIFKIDWLARRTRGARTKNNMSREHYEAYKRMLLKLHELDAQGKDQSLEANKIRDEMELPEQHLTEQEQERLNGLSGDLYMLVGTEVKEPSDPNVTRKDFFNSWQAQDWDRVLKLLQIKDILHIHEHQLAALRATCWEALGDYDVALLFIEHAIKLDPKNPRYHFLKIHLLLKLGRVTDADAETNQFVNPNSSEMPAAWYESVLQPA